MKKLLSLLPLFLLLLAGHSVAQFSYQDINSQLVNKSIGAVNSDNSGNVIITRNLVKTKTFDSPIQGKRICPMAINADSIAWQ